MGSVLIVSLALLGLGTVKAYNPYIISTSLQGCKVLRVGSSINKAYSEYFSIADLENNLPQTGEFLRTKICFRGPSNLFAELSDSNTTSPSNSLRASKFYSLV